MANKRKFKSAKAFADAVDKYLRSIRVRSVVYQVDSRGEYVRDADGRKVPCCDENGDEMFVETYVVPPELRDIAAEVGMSYDTWLKYASGEYDTDKQCFSEVCAEAKDVCLRWALREVATRHKGVDGIKWSLQVNYGMRETKEVELGADTRKALEVSSMTMEEKMARLTALPGLLSQLSDDERTAEAGCPYKGDDGDDGGEDD